MSNNQSSPDYPDDMRDLFEVSEDENVNSSGHQSPELSTQETSGELRQSKTKRKRSEDVANPTSPNDSDQKDMSSIRKKARQNSNTRVSLGLEKVGEKRKLSALLDDPNGDPKTIDEHDSPHSKRTRHETNINETMNSESLVENQLAEDKLQGEEIVAQRESSDEGEDQTKPRRKGPFSDFLDVEAEVSDEDDVDEVEEQEGVEDSNETHPDDDAQLRYGGNHDAQRHRALDHQREIESLIEADKQDRLIKERHQSRQTKKAKVPETVSKQLLLPTIDDPQIFMVPCKEGQERNVVMAIMKKMDEWKILGKRAQIISAFERGTTKMLSHVYVEGRNLDDIRLFLQGIQNLYVQKINTEEIPIKEMTALSNLRPTKHLEPGTFVRLKSGLYKGDWAQIDEIDISNNQVSLRLHPRLNYTAAGKKPGFRPVQRLFSAAEAKKGNPENAAHQNLRSLGENQWVYRKETYKDGFLIKQFKMEQLLVTEGQNPTLEIIQTFATAGKDGSASIDLSAVKAAKDTTARTGGYLVGETVEVYEGDHQGIRGKILVSRKEIVTVEISEPKNFLGRNTDITAKSVRRAFSIGDQVKVVGGRHRDEVGIIVSVNTDTVIFMSDNHEQLTVFRNDVRVSDDGGAPVGLGKFDMHDLVELDARTVGCITKVGRDVVNLLDQNGSIISLPPSQVGNKIERKQFVATVDSNGSEIRPGDKVRDIRNDQIHGVVLHIHHTFLFLRNRDVMENSGVFVVNSNNVTLTSARDGRLDKRTQGRPTVVAPFQRNSLKENTAMGPPPAKASNFYRFIGAAVSIRKGPYKGLRGLIRSVDDKLISVELQAKSKTIRVAPDAIVFVDKISGESLQVPPGFNAPRGGQGIPSTTLPGPGCKQVQNPTYSGGRTPAWGIAPTNSGGQTPVPNNGSRTVNPYADESTTSYGGSSYTPHWNPSSRTPHSSNHAFDAAGSRTPAYNNGPPSQSRIPAWMEAPQSSIGSRGNASRGGTSSSGDRSRYTGTARKGV